MRVAVASGKGGTGKTLVATNLATVLSAEERIALLDCDVEAPNAHLFLKPTLHESHEISKRVPVIDEARCSRCNVCVEACEFGALAFMAGHALVFEALCHGCGRCGLVCPEDAISERDHPLGVIETGDVDGRFPFAHGRLHIGEAMASPIIRALKQEAPEREWIILDAPPGTACPVISAIHGVDVVVLVTEPTPFGLHDLRAAVGVVRTLEIPAVAVINRDGVGDDGVERYCADEGLPVLLRIPFDRRIAETGAAGQLLIDALPEWREPFVRLASDLREFAR
jgi:MinD superfamily P-loop ATPase